MMTDRQEAVPEAVERALCQERTEGQLAESRARLDAFIRSSKDAIIIAESDGRITLFNPAAEQIFRCSADQALGQPFSRFLPRCSSSGDGGPDGARQGPDESSIRACDRGMRADGEEFPLEASVSHLEVAGRTFFTIVVRDITERKRAEEALRERDQRLRQKQTLETVGALAGGVAHEFNNLLQAIGGYARYAMDGLPTGEQRYQDLEQVLKATERAASLTRQLLGFSRRQEMQPRHVDPNQVVTDLINMLRPLIGEQIDLNVVLGRELGTVYGDVTMLGQMLLNLCLNARDAMPSGGRLQIRTEGAYLNDAYCEHNPGTRPGPYLLLTVADTGCGMSAEVKQHMFDPFFTTKEVGRGTGLGLPMVYGAVEQHGGSINVYSEAGVGTTVRIYLPCDRHAPESINAGMTPFDGGGTETILVAEDEPLVRDLAVRILRGAGYRTLVACDGQDAVRQFERHADEISLALVDLIMPKLTGRFAYEAMKQLNPAVRAIFCTGCVPDMDHADYIAREQVPLIEKPFDPQSLLRTVREVLDAVEPCRATQSTS